jgi:hypothetical protein
VAELGLADEATLPQYLTKGALSISILNYDDVIAVIFFHRRGAKIAESNYFLFAVERPRWNGMQSTANKKAQALRAKYKSDLRIAWLRI